MCGLVGMISTKRTNFDFTRFCTLGISNDIRGGDSVGIYIDGKYEYYCNNVSGATLFEDIIAKSELLHKTKEYSCAFAHCRKASIGYTISEKTAQPVIIANNKGEVEYVLMHNGTIYNASELAKKYIPDIDVKDMTDSQIMAHIFYYKGYSSLAEYNGSAVFMILDYREDKNKPNFLCWQGKSKESQYKNNGTEKDERPFYFVVNNDTFVMSSVSTFFSSLYPDCTIYTLPKNTLCCWDGELWIVEEYSRAKQQQDKEYYSTPVTHNSSTTYPITHTTHYNNDSVDVVTSSTVDGKCYKGNVALHGNYHISDYGRFCGPQGYAANEMWFWNGTLLKNSSAYTYLTRFQQELNATIYEIETLYPELILYLSAYPFYKVEKANGLKEMRIIDSPIGGHAYTGLVYYPFVRTQYKYENGVFQSSNNILINDSLCLYRNHKDDVLDYEILAQFGG